MILETFTHKEIYTTLRKAYTILQDRSKSYLSNNYNKIFSLCKDNDYERVVQGTINNQRFSLGVCYKRIGKSVIYGANTLHTVFLCGNRKFVIKMYPYGPNVESVQYGIAYFTEHFLNRFCERLYLCPSDTPLLEKARLYDMNTDLKVHELASRSGFNSAVSFGMAFKLYMGEKPGDWCRRERYRMDKLKK